MDTKLKETFNITNGPGRDVLMDAFKYAYHKTVNIPATFEISGEGVRSVSRICIQSIEHEDGSGEKFNLFGTCNLNLACALGAIEAKVINCSFKAYYCVRNRQGTISFYQ